MSYTGGELERREEYPPAPYRRGQHASGEISTVINWPELRAWARGRGVIVAGIALVALSLVWKGIFLGHYYLWQDDFNFTEVALRNPLSLHYLTTVQAGHMLPGVNLVFWLWARASLYNWTSASAITLIMLAAGGLAGLRVLRTLFGNRPAILVPLVLYLASPLTMPDIRFWSAALESVPLQAATFMALNAQVYYVRTGRFRHAVAAAAWLAIGLVFYEKTLVLPVLLFLVTSGFIMEGPWLPTAWRCLVRYWPSWLLQAGIVGIYAVVFEEALKTSSAQVGVPSAAGGLFTFTWDLLKESLLPGAIGGPWQWFPQPSSTGPEYAYAAPPQALIWLSVIVAVCVIGVSIWARKYAWRAWAIAVAWFVGADIIPIALGRIAELTTAYAALLGLETRYVSDMPTVLALCVGLAFLPIDGRPDLRRRVRTVTVEGLGFQPGRMAAAGLVGAFLIGSVFSVQSLLSSTTSLPDRIFIEDAKAAVDQAPAGTVIADQQVPDGLMVGVFGASALDSRVIGPMESAADKSRIRWTTAPNGTIDRFMVFGTDGLLHQANVAGTAAVPLPAGMSCYKPGKGKLVIQFAAKTFPGTDVLDIGYLAGPAENGKAVTVTWAGRSQRLVLKAGLRNGYLTERGSVSSVTFSGAPVTGLGLCIGGLTAGIVVPSPSLSPS